MFRLWGKLVRNNRILKDITIERADDDTRTHKVIGSLEKICHEWDLEIPIWLDKSVRDFQRNASARFYQDSFIEEIAFDYLEIQVVEE